MVVSTPFVHARPTPSVRVVRVRMEKSVFFSITKSRVNLRQNNFILKIILHDIKKRSASPKQKYCFRLMQNVYDC